MKKLFGNRSLWERNLNTPVFISLFVGFCTFIFSYTFMPFAIEGDQVHYRAFYSEVSGLGFFDAYTLFSTSLGSQEPGYFLLVYIFSGLLDKDLLMSFLNSALSVLLVYWLRKQNVSLLLILLLSLNFYLMVVFFSADRLKLALLLFMVAANCSGLCRNAALLASISSHVQLLLLYISILMKGAYRHFGRLVLKGKFIKPSLHIILIGFLCVIIVLFIQEHIIHKFIHYMEANKLTVQIWKPIFLAFLTMFYAKNEPWAAFMQHLVIVFAALFVGEERLVIFSYIIFMSYALQVNRGLNVGVLSISSYFFFKGIVFLYYIYLYGDGFWKVT